MRKIPMSIKDFFKKPEVSSEFDETFKKLLDVVPRNLSREDTRAYLKDFTLQELPEYEGVRADLFARPSCIPTNVLYVSYGTKNRAVKSLINIGYPSYIPNRVSQAHRKMMFNKLDSVLDESFRRAVNPDNIVYWCKGSVIIGKNLKKTKKEFKGAPYISVESFDTQVFPVEVVFKTLTKKAS